MFSHQFLSSYCIFTTIAAVHRDCSEELKSNPDAKAVADAFRKATVGMSKREQTELTQFMRRLLQLPEEYEQQEGQRYHLANRLDREVAELLLEVGYEHHVLNAEQLIAQMAISREILSEKLRQHRIFKLPKWVTEIPIPGEELYPSFFAHPQYSLSALESVSMALRASPGERKFRFFITPNPMLENRNPLEAIADGELERVIAAAKRFRRNPGRIGT